MLEPYEGKLSCTVLRGESGRNTAALLDMDYKYSGKLPGKASVRIPVGTEYAGKNMNCVLLNADGTYGQRQSVTVDADGYITVVQEEGATYIVTAMTNKLGDVNGDNNIDSKDALAVLKESVGLEQAVFIKEAADVNKDTKIDSKDALMILKHSVGLLEIQ